MEWEAVSYEKRDLARKQKFYLTTAIHYLNGPPHVGHAYEMASADALSRYHALVGRDSYFLTGSDEHGQKIFNTATKQNLTPQQLCDKNVLLFHDLNKALGLREHQFIRTTNPDHKAFAQWLWKRVEANGDIYKGSYEGWYNVREETFLTERDAAATNYVDPDTKLPYEKRHEESYFFKMSKYHDQVYDFISTTDFAQPVIRRNELLARLDKAPLEDLSISRTNLKWGIPVPDDQDHVMYVWFDALSNYASAIGLDKPTSSEKAYLWPADVHIIGKDIIWFHCVIWPAMLMAAKLPLPRHVFGHGFVKAGDGNKMGKSLGNVIDPMTALERVGSDSFRWFLLKDTHYGADIKFSPEGLIDLNNSDLASTLGNLLHRGLALCIKNCDSKIPTEDDVGTTSIVDVEAVFNSAEEAMSKFAIEEVCEIGLNICRKANQYLTEKEPWKIKGDDAESVSKRRSIIRSVLEAVFISAHFLWPAIPKATEEIFARLNSPRKSLVDLKPKSNLVSGTTVSTGPALFPRIDSLDIQ